MSSRHHRRSYRVIAISCAFLLIGAALFVPLAASPDRNYVLLFVLLGVWLALWIGTIVINEIVIKKKYGGDFLAKKDGDKDE